MQGTVYHLWVDGVGGFLVCLAPRVCLGQASPNGSVDVPLLADVSRFHASIVRDNEGYVVESGRPLQVNGKLTQKAPLASGDRITLGAACQFVFERPVPLSATATLHLQSGQRFPLSLDGVILMAETLVIGQGPQAHVPCDAVQPVILFRAKEGLGVRYTGNLLVDGQPVKGRANLQQNATITGPDFNFAIEPAKNWKKSKV